MQKNEAKIRLFHTILMVDVMTPMHVRIMPENVLSFTVMASWAGHSRLFVHKIRQPATGQLSPVLSL